jgi:hypothetical protein
MIQISRPSKGPLSLQRSGEKQTRLDCAAYDINPDDYNSGRKSFDKRTYYNGKTVKDLLIRIHRSKCCYCEKRYLSRGYLHVEHFRPKSGVRQTNDQTKDELPGYYWLAYCWDNLLLSCLDCNCSYKRTLFPLANPKNRARSHRDDISRERPLFVDPVDQDPRDHVRFDDDLPTGITSQGVTTINKIGLRRVELREDRLALLKQIRVRQDILSFANANPVNAELQALAKAAREYIDMAMQPDAEFSSMVIDYVTRQGV